LANSSMKNYFAVLQIPENSSHDDIQRHIAGWLNYIIPDVSTATDAIEKFCEITEAYEFLMNHWPQRAIRYPGETVTQQTFEEYLKTDAYEKFRQEVREQAYGKPECGMRNLRNSMKPSSKAVSMILHFC